MTVFVLIPVFNRLHHTQKVVEALRQQTLLSELRIIVINDGSVDGTEGWLALQGDITQLSGDGNLWWGGAIDRGLRYVLTHASQDDHVLFINNDTWFAPNYVETLLQTSRNEDGAVVGSVVHEENCTPPLTSIGARVDIDRFAVWDVWSELQSEELAFPKPTYRVDALSGRGTLYSVALFRKYGTMRPKLLPHYLADYEIAMRFARKGAVPLVVSSRAIVFSPPVYGNDVTGLGLWSRLFSTRSSGNIFRRLIFYTLVGSPLQRITAPFRMLYFASRKCLHQLGKKLTLEKYL